MTDNKDFLPVSLDDMKKRNIDALDFVFITGDAYIDHPSFGTAIIARVLEKEGFNVGIIPQPDWNNIDEFKKLGKPKLAFLINSGNIDSMVNHYSVSKHRRNKDMYTPNGEIGKRPDRAVIVYSNKAREAYKDVPVIIGGIEASLRRFAHYDYWQDKVRRSILLDSKADILSYGMGEKSIVQIANLLRYGKSIKDIKDIRGTCFIDKAADLKDNCIMLPSYEEILESKNNYNKAFKIENEEQNPLEGKALAQKHGDVYVVQNPPQLPLTEEEMDIVYSLNYRRGPHPMYKGSEIPAIEEVKFSITSHRGCFGSCAFCALTFHQGRIISKRSQSSILDEAKALTKLSEFKGYIHDVGGPTANFRNRACSLQDKNGVCKDRQCLYPAPCKNLRIDHNEYLELLRKLRKIEGVKKVFIRSGIRYDYLIYDKDDTFLKELCEYHISGQLKVAPEHISDKVLSVMRKPGFKVYKKFMDKYNAENKRLNKKQYLVPYLMSSHPGCDLNEAIKLAQFIKELGYMPEQVQDFYPTPGSLSTAIYYTGVNPLTGEQVYVPKSQKEKNMQRALLQFNKKENYKLVHEALTKAGRLDLIGNSKNALIKNRR